MSQLLFPEIIPVSQQEIENWLDLIPNLSATPSRRLAYAKAYRVEEKIRNKKSAIRPLETKKARKKKQ
jgi:hypothetical protein